MEKQDFIASKGEAVLCVAWTPIFLVGFVLVFVAGTPVGWAGMFLAAVDVATLLWFVQRRTQVPAEHRRVLARWLTANAQYAGWMTLLGRTPPDSR